MSRSLPPKISDAAGFVSSTPPSAVWPRWIAAGLLVAAGLIAWHNSFSGPFVFDDVPAIEGNATIRRWWPLPGPLSLARKDLTVSGRPLVNATLAVNHALGGTRVEGYHALNLAIHLLAGLTLFGVVRRTLEKPALRDRFGQAALPLAFVVALLWTVHPLQTEAVTYVIQRVESLMGLFFLLTIYCFIRSVASPRPLRWRIAAVTACLAGMASKEVMAAAPLLIFLYDRTFVAGSFRAAWQQRWRLHVGLAATWLLLAFLITATAQRGGTAGLGIGFSSWDYLLTQCRAIVMYLKLSFWPHPLVFDHGSAVVGRAADVLPQALLLAVLGIGTLLALWRRPALGFLGAWFFVILAPSSSFVPVASQTMAEHRMYLPLAAVVAFAVLAVHTIAGRKAMIAFLVLALGAVALTVRRNSVYRSAISLWQDTVEHCPQNPRAHSSLGTAWFDAGRFAEAAAAYEQALRLQPDAPEAHANLCNAYAKLGRAADAVRHGDTAVRLDPMNADARINLGLALLQLDRPSEAVAHFEAAVRLQPEAADAHVHLAATLVKLDRSDAAIEHYETALRLDSRLPDACFALGNLRAGKSEFAAAITQFQRVLELDPTHVAARNNLANALLVTGKIDDAIAAYREVLRSRPNDASVRRNLDEALTLQAAARSRQ